MNKGREEVNYNDPKQVSTNHEPRVPYPKEMTKDRIEEQFSNAGDDTVTLQARDSVKTYKTQDKAMKLVDDKINIQSSLQEPPRTKTMETVHYYQGANKDTHEERRLQIEELDEWRAHKPRIHDKPKLLQNKPDTYSNQFKVGDKVLLDAADPHIVTTIPNEEIPLTVLSIFPFGMVEVSYPKFGTFKGKRHGRVEAGHDFPKTRGAINPYGHATWPWVNLIGSHGRGNGKPRANIMSSSRGKKATVPSSKRRRGSSSSSVVMTNNDDPGTIHFRLGGLVRAMSVQDFGVALGLYTDEFMEEEDMNYYHEISTFLPPCAGKLWHHSLPPTTPAARKPQLSLLPYAISMPYWHTP
ncbi:hypothetical protein GOBAR_AA21568 [Gossypium barbadense]|uniref:Uncharacterized protein n=1 Tax=Gossypium barbadense TaxID=3634 RepID=A0A2P5X6Y4_GOSBA|nr:hypothetical protein GOBAR_AA21568 [Gossypium barbadense]